MVPASSMAFFMVFGATAYSASVNAMPDAVLVSWYRTFRARTERVSAASSARVADGRRVRGLHETAQIVASVSADIEFIGGRVRAGNLSRPLLDATAADEPVAQEHWNTATWPSASRSRPSAPICRVPGRCEYCEIRIRHMLALVVLVVRYSRASRRRRFKRPSPSKSMASASADIAAMPAQDTDAELAGAA
jgi:hypothetical protein